MLSLLNRNQESPAMGMVMTVPYLVIPLSGLLMLFWTWADLILHWSGIDPHPPEEAVDLSREAGF